jgi:hypothetical protein
MLLRSLNYGGDGDEVIAIEHVEHEFGVKFGQEDADGWVTVDDVFTSLLIKLGIDRDGEALWPRFAEALARENGYGGADVGRETLLLAEPTSKILRRAIKRLFGR